MRRSLMIATLAMVLGSFLFLPAAFAAAGAPADPVSLYKIGIAWDFPPYLMVNVPATPGDILITQGPFPHIAPVLRKSGFITGHCGVYSGRKDIDNDGVEEYAAAEAARYGVWYGYYYPLRQFEKGHGKLGEMLEKDGDFAKTMKKFLGENLGQSAFVKKYDELLDGTYMGARTVDAITESPNEYEYRRKILEFCHNYVLMNCDYNYDGFRRPLESLFSGLNTNGTGGFGKGHNEKFTCVGLSEAAYEYAGVDVVPRHIEETHAGLTPLKQFLYSKPASKVYLNKGEKVSFEAWHVIHGKRTYEPAVKVTALPAGCTFDGKTFTADGSVVPVGVHEIIFSSVQYPDQRQKIKLLVGPNNRLPNFDYKSIEAGFKGITKVTDDVKSRVDAIVKSGDGSKKDRDQKLLSIISSCQTIDDIVYAARNIGNGNARDIALLYGVSLASSPNDLYKLTMFADSGITVNKILYSPLGYKISGIDNALHKITSAGGLSLLYNMRCGSVLKDALRGDYVFSRSVRIPLKISYSDVSSMNAAKIKDFIKFLCANPKEINKIENAYLISLIQKRIYFAMAAGEPGAAELRAAIKAMADEAASKAKPGDVDNKSSVVSDQMIVVRFLDTMSRSLDLDSKWLDKSFKAESAFMKALAPAMMGIPGMAAAAGNLFSETATSVFSKQTVTGTLSPELTAYIAANDADFASRNAGASAERAVDETAGPAAVTAPAAITVAPARITAASSEDIKKAYDEYRAAYQKYLDAVSSGAPEEETKKMVQSVSEAFNRYRSLAEPTSSNGNENK